MDSYPIPAQSLERHYHIDGSQLERHYKEHLSDYREWDQLDHADKWLLIPENMGTHLSIDETSLSNGELYPHYSSLTKMSLIDQVFMPCRFSFDYFLSHELFWPCYSVIRRDISVFIAQKMVFFTSKHNSPFNL